MTTGNIAPEVATYSTTINRGLTKREGGGESDEPKGSSSTDIEAGCCVASDGESCVADEGLERNLSGRIPHCSRPLVMSVLIMLIGCLASTMILAFGVSAGQRDQVNEFERISNNIFAEFDLALRDYLMAVQWIHQAFRTSSENGSQTHEDFEEIYENIVSNGVVVNGISFAVNVSSEAQRRAMENDTRAYLERAFPEYDGYQGFREFTSNGTLAPMLPNAAPVYFPVHYAAPIKTLHRMLDSDTYTSPPRRMAIEQALRTWKPTITARLQLGFELQTSQHSVILIHPGLPLVSRPEVVPRDVSFVGIKIPDVVRRMRTQAEHIFSDHTVAIYIFDSTAPDASENDDATETEPPFLGGAMLHANTIADGTDLPMDTEIENAGIDFLPEVSLSSLTRHSASTYQLVSRYPFASREWTFIVMADRATFQPEITFVVMSAVLIFVACTCTALWVYTNYRRVARIHELQSNVEAEKADKLVEKAREATRVERELNDFIAHEVRNPLSAAVSACSFVRYAIKCENSDSAESETSPLVLDHESTLSIREDVSTIDTSLRFINDLLRNMLHMHRALSNQLSIEIAPVDILHDVFLPIKPLLYTRGTGVEVLVECPQNLVVQTDCLRLKQVVLNLGRNSLKFVQQKGFIRFRATVNDENSVRIYIEDSGPGIPLRKRDKLFTKFQESLDSLNQGTGIGLCLCKNLVGLMAGELWLDESYRSGVDGYPGTRFVVDLKTTPLSIDSVTGTLETQESLDVASESGGSSQRQVGSGADVHPQQQLEQQELPRGVSVLFVDDNMVLRKLFSRSVRRATTDWNICEAASGETALQLVEEQEFDVIFLDQYMASVEQQLLGTETARAFRAKGVRSIICGLSANDLEKSFIEAGADTFMMKPFPCEEEALKRALLDVLAFRDTIVSVSPIQNGVSMES